MEEIDHTFWFVTRASGVVAYLLLTASVALGLVLTGDLMPRRVQRFRVYDIHRFVALVTLGLTLLHVFVVLPDRYFSFSLIELLVPFASPYRPAWMAIGVFALWLMLIVVGAFYLRPLVSYRLWRLLHYATFAVFALALLHGAGAGTDAGAAWSRAMYTLSGLLVFNLGVYRALRGSARGVPQRPPSQTSSRAVGEVQP
jgi:predicted ferric reductase